MYLQKTDFWKSEKKKQSELLIHEGSSMQDISSRMDIVVSRM